MYVSSFPDQAAWAVRLETDLIFKVQSEHL